MHSLYKKTNYHSIPNEYRIISFLFFFFLILSGCKQANKSSSDAAQKINASLPPSNNEYFQEIGKEIGLNFIHSIGGPDLNNIS